jgi:RNA polymerase sigma-70 factor (ECF subfamily)
VQDTSTEHIIQAVKNGDTDAFNTIINLHQQAVFNLAFRMLKNREDAEEVAQDSFVKAYQKLKFFKGQSKFSTWLYRITYTTGLNKIKSNKKHLNNQSLDAQSDHGSTPELSMGPLLQIERTKFLKIALQRLTDQQQMLLTLYYQNECDLAEIEEITRTPKNTIKVQLHRARKALKSSLEALLAGEIENIKS